MLELVQEMKISQHQELHIYCKKWQLKELLEDQRHNFLKKSDKLEESTMPILIENSQNTD